MSTSQIHAMLNNDYYVGVVRYAGQSYPGRHEPLIPLPLFQQVQRVLEAKRLAGERDRVHHHYLKGSLYCGECGARLMFSRNRGRNGDTHDYFVCVGRQRQTCSQRYRPVKLVEIAVARHWSAVQLTDVRYVCHAVCVRNVRSQKHTVAVDYDTRTEARLESVKTGKSQTWDHRP